MDRKNNRKQRNFLEKTTILPLLDVLTFDFAVRTEEKLKMLGVKNAKVKSWFGMSKDYDGVIFVLNDHLQFEAKFYKYINSTITYDGFWDNSLKRVFTKKDDFIVTDSSLLSKINFSIEKYQLTKKDNDMVRYFVLFDQSVHVN